MNTKNFSVDYSSSGIKTLRFLAWFNLISGCLLFPICFILSISENDFSFVVYGSTFFVTGLISFGLFLCIATITESFLYKKSYIQYKVAKEEEMIQAPLSASE